MQYHLRMADVDYVAIPFEKIPAKRMSGYYGYLCTRAALIKEELKDA